jgi:hypothetical protein
MAARNIQSFVDAFAIPKRRKNVPAIMPQSAIPTTRAIEPPVDGSDQDILRRKIQSPQLGASCPMAASHRTFDGTTSSGFRSAAAARIF